jgi:cobalt-zinc-cadmium efflux system membrane fusion protein
MTRCLLACALGLVCALNACRGADKSPATASLDTSAEKAQKDQIVLSPTEQTTARIDTQPAMIDDAPVLLRVSGRIARADDRTWRVGVRSEGLVMTVHANLGAFVRKGEVLARYHADEVREERAKYRRATVELRRAEGAATQAQRNYERMETLLGLKAASSMQVEQARQDLLAADTAVKNAQIEVDRGKDVLEDDLRVPADPTPGDEAADQVPILAPEAGYVLEKNVTPGRTIAPGQDAFVIGDLSQVWMLAAVRQEELAHLQVGQSVSVTLPGFGDERVTGTISNLGQELDPTTRVMPVRIVLNNPGTRLRPEMLINAEIRIGGGMPTLMVPSDAVQQINGQDVVFVRTTPDHFVLRPLRVGRTMDAKTPVLEGLAAGEQVVVRGSFVLKSHLLRSTIAE